RTPQRCGGPDRRRRRRRGAQGTSPRRGGVGRGARVGRVTSPSARGPAGVKSALDKVREAPGSTKARILAAAQEVFAAKGFEGASTREIAARAEVNISSLHYHWESKERLYLAIFERILQQLVDLLRDEIVIPESPEDARAVVERAMGLTFDFY